MSFKKTLMRIFRALIDSCLRYTKVQKELEDLKILTAKPLIDKIKKQGILESLHDAEFKVFSQFGDDGIIQYIIHNICISDDLKIFIEFGVEDYMESNTRFLLLNNNWKGLVIDGNLDNIKSIQKRELYWRHDLTAIHAFVTKDNINSLFVDNGFQGEIGILSIDIDGNDYWVWDSIETVNPLIVIIEYNSTWGPNAAVTIPYDENFVRSKAHWSYLYWGCSLRALNMLAKQKGYIFIGCNSAGNNAYFLRSDKINNIPACSVKTGYVDAKFRESREINGKKSYVAPDKKLNIIEDMEVYDVKKNQLVKIKNLGI
jgi:hypothetical protein